MQHIELVVAADILLLHEAQISKILCSGRQPTHIHHSSCQDICMQACEASNARTILSSCNKRPFCAQTVYISKPLTVMIITHVRVSVQAVSLCWVPGHMAALLTNQLARTAPLTSPSTPWHSSIGAVITHHQASLRLSQTSRSPKALHSLYRRMLMPMAVPLRKMKIGGKPGVPKP